MMTLKDNIQKHGNGITKYFTENDVEHFIELLKGRATTQTMLDFDKNPITENEWKEGKDFAHCGGCGRFVIEEGCTCGMIHINDIDLLSGFAKIDVLEKEGEQ